MSLPTLDLPANVSGFSLDISKMMKLLEVGGGGKR